MSEFSKQNLPPQEEKEPQGRDSNLLHVYHWNYAAQTAYDCELKHKQNQKGAWTYALVMSAVFIVCISLLLIAAFCYRADQPQNPNFALQGENVIGTVADAVNPATVLILASDGYTTSFGTGFFIRSDGYIATNDHVVANRSEIQVRLYTGEILKAEYVAGSSADDLAVLKVKGTRYPTVRIGDSSKVRVGDLAIAIGHPSGEEATWTTTQGIISSTKRIVSVSGTGYTAEVKMMQTDAPVNRGNSGGPLCNAKGEVIGIVARKLTDYEGIGFAIPINEAMQSLEKMIDGTFRQSESTVAATRPSIGISVAELTAGTVLSFENGEEYMLPYHGVCVQKVVAGSGADGVLEIGDVIYAMDGKAVSDVASLQALLYRYNVGDSVTFQIFRRGTETEVTVRLGIG